MSTLTRFLKFRPLSSHVSRNYARKAGPKTMKRSPVKILYEGETIYDKSKRKKEQVASVLKTTSSVKPKDRSSKFQLPENIRYERLPDGDLSFGKAVMTAKSKKLRQETKTILLEGRQLVIDAINSSIPIASIYFDLVEHLEGIPLESTTVELFRVKTAQMKLWSNQTAPTVMAIASMPSLQKYTQPTEPSITLICNQIRDPGNLGTLLRTAVACGCHTVLTTKGSCDIWDPKVLRSGCGAHFHISPVNGISWDKIGHWIPPGSFICLADNTTAHTHHNRHSPKVIPSLIKSISERGSQELFQEHDPEFEQSITIDPSFRDQKLLKLYERVPLATSSLFDVDFSEHPHVVVVIGGETEGLGVEAKKLAFDHGGQFVFVPMLVEMDSLNAAVAGSVILYEVRRQLMKIKEQKFVR